jgi:hypothetical protein
MTLRRGAGAAFALALALLPRTAAAQCAMCQATLTSSAEGRALGGPLNHAILLLFAAPYVVLGCFVFMAFRERILRRLARALDFGRAPARHSASR